MGRLIAGYRHSPRPLVDLLADRRLVLAGAALSILLALALVPVAAAQRDGGRSAPEVRIQGDVPRDVPALTAVGTARVEHHGLALRAPAAVQRESLTVTVVLKRTEQEAFDRYLRGVYDPHSRIYDHFLTQAQLATRFGPTLSEYEHVRAWLRSQGFEAVQGTANRLSLSARGTVRAAERAFDTPISELRSDRQDSYTNLLAPAVPRSLAPSVQAVMGLSSLDRPLPSPLDQHKCQNAGSLAATYGNAKFLQNCGNLCLASFYNSTATLPGTISDVFGAIIENLAGLAGTAVNAVLLSPYCLGTWLADVNPSFGNFVSKYRGFFGLRRPRRALGPALSGSPPTEKLGLLEFDTYDPADVTDWLNLLGAEPQLASHLSEVNVNGGVASPGAGESEVLVDIDTALAGAPLSDVVVYDAPASTSFVQMFQSMIAGGDTVISNSWAQCEDQTPLADAQAIDSVLASAAASGITVLNGTGDDGSTCLDGSANTISVPADSPNATAVGGTTPSFGTGLTYGSESWWDDQSSDPPSGAGGYGVSRYFSRPAYQNGLTDASTRSVPDISFDAEPEAGLSICQADSGGCPDGQLWGGTSMATPAVAAMVADVDQELGHDVGDLNAVLYPLAGSTALHSAASMGSDFAHVGLGSPNFANVLLDLSGASTGAVSPSVSQAGVAGQPQADGSQQGLLRVDLEDANGFPVGGRTVTVTANAGSSAVVSPASATTDPTDGAAVFTVTDTTPETVTFTVKDTTDNVTLATQPTLTFAPPAASGASITGEPSTVANDGSSQATISVYLQTALGEPASGKTVSLSDNGGNATISPASGQAVTGSNGYATFTATDTAQQSVSFTATDVTDGNLPVPGSAVVTFEAGGSSSCVDALPTGVSPVSVSAWASGLAYNPQALDIDGVDYYACSGVNQPVFDSSGNLYVPDGVSGQIYVLGANGGAASSADALPDATFTPGQLGGLAFGKDGSLYAGLSITNNSFFDPEVVQLDPTTGAIERVVATASSMPVGLQTCPFAIAVDPLTGDLFTTSPCTFGFQGLTRISDPESANPSVTTYTSLPYSVGLASAGLAFAPDGTIYVALPGADEVVSVTGTNGPATPVVTEVASVPYTPSGVAVASTNGAGAATALYVSGWSGSTGTISRVDLTATLPNATTVATGSGDYSYDVLGPDGCVYDVDLDQISRISSGAACAGTSSDQPEVTLQQSSGSATPGTGSAVGFTATLQNVPSPLGTPVRFEISGPNLGVQLANANGSGQAVISYAGVSQGVDTITASADLNGTTVTSAPVQVHWMAGKDTTFIDLNTSQQGGPVGQAATLTASLWDETESPVTPIGGQTLTLGLGSAKCSAQTNASGVASCQLTPSAAGLQDLTAGFAGDAQYTPASATSAFDASEGTPINLTAPSIGGSPEPGHRLTCTTGSWLHSPTLYGYQWERNGVAIGGATGSSYVVQIADEATTLRCVVTASNADGTGASATSAGILVALPGTLTCAKPSGRLSGTSVGPLRLGMTLKAAVQKLKRYTVTHYGFDNFCLYAGWGIRVGFASRGLLRALSTRERSALRGGIVLALTANPYYRLDGVPPGTQLTKRIASKLGIGKVFVIGLNDWYIARGPGASGVLKVRGGVIQEVGLASLALTSTQAAQHRLLTSFRQA